MIKKSSAVKGLLLLLNIILLVPYATAQIPNGYYNSATGTGNTLKNQLHNIIDDHVVVDYNTVYVRYNVTDIDPNDGYIYDMYSENPSGTDPYNYSYWVDDCGVYNTEGDCYNREHSFPKSWFGGETLPMFSDIHHVIPTDGQVNSWRNNYPYGETSFPSIISQNGSKVGSGRSGLGYSGTVFEPIDEFKGDIARIYFYMATRYQDILTNWPGSAMLDGSSTRVYEQWAVDMLLDWHENDPVSQKEIDRNNAIYYFVQANRNPFVDHPEYVDAIWGDGEICSLGAPFTTGASRCGPGSVTLFATPAFGGSTCRWYASPSSSTVLNTGTTYTTTVSGTKVFYVSTVNGDCESSSRSSVLASVQVSENVSMTGLDDSYCDDFSLDYIYGTPGGGTFSGPGISSSVFGAYFSPNAVGPGTYTITYSYFNGSCTAEATKNVTVYEVPEASINGLASVYQIDDGLVSITGFPVGGSFSGTGISGNTFDPQNAGIGTHVISYFYSNNGCLDIAERIVTVTGNSTSAGNSDLILSGIYDGPLAGHPKGVELYVVRDIVNLSAYGFGSASNGGGSDGVEFTFPAISVTQGSFLYLAADSAGFRQFMGFDADFIDISAGINGNDAVELFLDATLIDAFGDKNDATFDSEWAYQDGWAFRKDCTGPDAPIPSSLNWTFSGVDALDFESSNATAAQPIPVGTYFCDYCDATTNSISVTTCDSYLSPSGKVWTTSNVYFDTIPNADNCDSIITVNLDINQTAFESLTVNTCDQYVAPSGKILTQSATYMDTVVSSLGCDSIITIDLTINQSTSSNITIEACDSYISPSGQIWTESNIYEDLIPNAAGCDSTITIDLTINESSLNELLFFVCDSFVSFSGKVWDESGVYFDTTVNAFGCPSIFELDLRISKSTKSSVSRTACGTFISPSGKIWDKSGTYSDTISNSNNCDSIITVDLTINQSTSSNIVIEACDSYISPSGQIWTESNIYEDLIPNAAGCDSTITIDLTINESSLNELLFFVCDSFVSFSGKVWDESGVYFDTTVNAFGCPSISEFDLRINKSTKSSISRTACDTFISPSGKTWNFSGLYLDTIANSNNCDSIITIDLTIDEGVNYISETACNQYTSPSGQTWTTSDTYTDSVFNGSCWDVYVVDLTIVSMEANIAASGPVLTADPSGGQYEWLDCSNGNAIIANEIDRTYTAEANGSYAVRVSKNGCVDTSDCVDVLTTEIDIESFNSPVIIYPNPTKGLLNIHINLDNNTDVSIRISDLMGRLIEEFHETITANSFHKTLDLNNYPSGLYMIKIQQGNDQAIHKISITD